jgi:hypothetical protein
MNLEYQQHLPREFAAQSRVWIYQASRMLTLAEVRNWKSHGDEVKGFANLFFGRFLILIADETQTGVGGCSTDSSVRFIKTLEQKFKIDFFNRQLLAFVIKDKIELLPLSQLEYALTNGFINEETLYFNNTVITLEELKKQWIIPAKASWLATRLPAIKSH